jgi:xylulokinase
VLIDDRQKITATASSPLKVSRPHDGWSEQRPEDWWKAANAVVKTLGKLKPKAIAAVDGIGLSGQQHGATLLDKAGHVLRPCILWNDARSFEECKDILAREPRALAISGNIPLAGYTAPKLVWVKKHEPRVFDAVDKVLLPKDYIRYRMTGEFASDMSDSSGTYWLDVAKRQWSDDLLRASDMRRDQMPRLCEGTDATGRLTAAVAKAWGMPKRPVVAGGGGDNAAAACGIGAVTDGAAFVSIGTSGVMFVLQRQVQTQCGPGGSCVLPCGSRHVAPDGSYPVGNGQLGMAGRRPQNTCPATHQGVGHKTFRALIGTVPALSFR